MGAIGGLLGTAGGANGTGFKAPGSVNIQQGTNAQQIADSYQSGQNALDSQQALLQAIQAQQGLGAQSSALSQQQGLSNQLAANNAVGKQASNYAQGQTLANQQAQLGSVGAQNQALQAQQGLNSQLANANGVGNQSAALQAQQNLAAQQQGTLQQYQNIANGTGPNPAQAALNQATGQNVANQAALMAGQRGAGSNVGMLARQAAQQGAATQQQAVGQGATMQAQQQLNALSGLTAQQQAIGGTNNNVANIAAQQVGQQQAGIGSAQQAASNLTAQQQAQQQALAAQAAQQVGQQQAQQQAQAGQANVMAGQRIGATAANTQAQQAEQGILQNALSQANQQNVSMQSNINAANAGMTGESMKGQKDLIGGGISAIGKAAAGSAARGGMVQTPNHYYDGGMAPQAPAPVAPPTVPAPMAPVAPPTNPPGAMSSFGNFLSNMGSSMTPKPAGELDSTKQMFNMAGSDSSDQRLQKGAFDLGNAIASRMKSSPAPAAAPAGAKGGLASKGGNVNAKNPEQKAEKKGNSYDNDKIPAYLSEGEVVIPRSVMQGKDPARGAADFVAKVLAKKRKSA